MTPEPLKMIGLLQRRADLSLAQFSRHWRTVHRDLALRLVAPGIMLGYTQNHRLAEGGEIDGIPVAGDGFPELWVADAEVLTRIADAPEYREGAYLDEPHFMDGRSQSVVAREHIIREGDGRWVAATQIKALLFFRRAECCSAASFAQEFLRPPHPVLLSSATNCLRLTRHVAIPLAAGTRSECDGIQVYDGIEASYWPDAASCRAACRSRAAAPSWLHATAGAVGVLVHEEPVLIPAHDGPLAA